jgi:hypothetical protein
MGYHIIIRICEFSLRGKSRSFQGLSEPTLAVSHGRVCRSCAGMVCMAGVDLEWSHSMAHALALDTRTWPREDVPGLGLTDEDVGLLRG